MKSLKQSEIASALGVAQPLISRWVKRGMPTTSVEAAAKWREAYTDKSRSRRPQAPVKTEPVAGVTVEMEDAQKLADPVPRLDSYEEAMRYLSDLENTRKFARGAAAALYKKGQVEDSRKWVAVHQNIANRYPVIRKELLRIQKEASELLVAKDVEAVTAAHMAKLRSIVDSWPAALAAKCNPSDPELARMQLESARDQLFRAMSAKV